MSTPTELTAVRLAGYDEAVYLPLSRESLSARISRAHREAAAPLWLLNCPMWARIGNDFKTFLPMGKADVNLCNVGCLSGPVKVAPHKLKRLADDGYLQTEEK